MSKGTLRANPYTPKKRFFVLYAHSPIISCLFKIYLLIAIRFWYLWERCLHLSEKTEQRTRQWAEARFVSNDTRPRIALPPPLSCVHIHTSICSPLFHFLWGLDASFKKKLFLSSVISEFGRLFRTLWARLVSTLEPVMRSGVLERPGWPFLGTAARYTVNRPMASSGGASQRASDVIAILWSSWGSWLLVPYPSVARTLISDVVWFDFNLVPKRHGRHMAAFLYMLPFFAGGGGGIFIFFCAVYFWENTHIPLVKRNTEIVQ